MTGDGAEDAIERLYREHDELVGHLLETQMITWKSRVDEQFAKTLLLAVASYFEARITECVVEVFEDATGGSTALVSFVRTKAVERRYHDWFDWNARNANRFFRAFGDEFREMMGAKCANDPELNDAVSAFVELGKLRNQLVHENYATFSMQKTPGEVLLQYRAAMRFVDTFANDLREHIVDQEAVNTC